MDRNGYNESIFHTKNGKCIVCGENTDTARHEVFFGVGNRKLSKKYGLWVNVCPTCHSKIHSGEHGLDRWLKKFGQMEFEKKHTRDEFMKLFGRNYL